MKRILVVGLCAVAFLLAGCASDKSPLVGKCCKKPVAAKTAHHPKYHK